LCKLDEILSKENYFEKSFLIDTHLISQNRSFNLRSLIDSDSVVYIIIHSNLVNKVCEKLKIQSISLAKEKLIKDYDGKIFKKTITHKILLNLIIESHKKLTVSMLIADIDHHKVILSKLWMNKNEILLNMQNDVIVFSNQLNTSISIFSILLNSKHLSWSRSTSSSLDWLHWVEYSTRKVSSRIEIFLKKCRVELRSWTQALKSSWEAWFNNSIRKFDLIRQDIR